MYGFHHCYFLRYMLAWASPQGWRRYQVTHKYNATMIGIILWAIAIIVIVICACPGFMTALIVNTTIVLSVYGLIAWIICHNFLF